MVLFLLPIVFVGYSVWKKKAEDEREDGVEGESSQTRPGRHRRHRSTASVASESSESSLSDSETGSSAAARAMLPHPPSNVSVDSSYRTTTSALRGGDEGEEPEADTCEVRRYLLHGQPRGEEDVDPSRISSREALVYDIMASQGSSKYAFVNIVFSAIFYLFGRWPVRSTGRSPIISLRRPNPHLEKTCYRSLACATDRDHCVLDC